MAQTPNVTAGARRRVHESYEAWVLVRLTVPDPDRHPELFLGLTVDHGVLTWENSH